MLERVNVRFVREMTNALMTVELDESLDSARSTEVEIVKKAVGRSLRLDATTSAHSMLPTASGNSVYVKTIVVVNGRSSLIDRGRKNGHKNSLTDPVTIVDLPALDPHSKIVVSVKVLEVQNDPAKDEKVLVPDRSHPKSEKAVAVGLNVLVEVINGVQTTVHAAEVPDTLSSSFCPS